MFGQWAEPNVMTGLGSGSWADKLVPTEQALRHGKWTRKLEAIAAIKLHLH